MGEKERKGILEYITDSSGYDIALMTTFNFEINYFERAILYQLTAHNVKTISVYVDAAELSSSLTEVESCHIGRRYMVNPVRISGAFHPKVVLLLGEKKAKLIVASANITTSGYAINNEVYGCIGYIAKNPEYLDVICDAIDFFVGVDKLSYQLDSDTIKEVTTFPYYRRARRNGKLSLIHNLNRPILEQVKDSVTERINSIYLAVPYYDPQLVALSSIKTAFPDAREHLYIQNNRSTFPKDYNDENHITDNINIFRMFLDNKSRAFYHGKVFLFKGTEHDYILYGSANCTQAALASTHADNGNVECCFLVKGEPGEFDAYFNNMELCNEEPLGVNKMVFEPKETAVHFFKYCKVDEKDVCLHFNHKTGISPKITINGISVDYTLEGKDLVAVLPETLKEEVGSLFYADFSYDETTEQVKCWVYNPEAIRNFRIKTVSDSTGLDSFDINAEGDKYLQDRINIINADNEYYREVAERNKQMAYYNQTQRDDDDDLSEEESFIVEVDIPEDYNFTYRKHQKVESIRSMYLDRLYRRYSFLSKRSGGEAKPDTPVDKPEPGDEDVPAKKRAPSSDEKRFYRFLKSRIKGLTGPKSKEVQEEIDKIEPMPLLSRVQIYIEPFSKYRYVDLFDSSFAVESRVELFRLLLTKDFSTVDKENIEYIVLLECYKALAENYFLITSEKDLGLKDKLNDLNRELLSAMDKKYKIRTDYAKHVSDLMRSEDPALKQVYEEVLCKYIEELFGYKNLELLEEYAASIYNDASIEISGTKMVINGSAARIKNHFNPNMMLIREIRNFSQNCIRVDSAVIVITNSDTSGASAVERLEHDINFRTRNWTLTTVYKNGKPRRDPPERLNI